MHSKKIEAACKRSGSTKGKKWYQKVLDFLRKVGCALVTFFKWVTLFAAILAAVGSIAALIACFVEFVSLVG